jgi:acyl dehydratase
VSKDGPTPHRAGDRITATGVVEEIDERGVVTVGLQCTNQLDEVVVGARRS